MKGLLLTDELIAVTKSGKMFIVYTLGTKTKFAPVDKYHPMCVNYFDPAYQGSKEDCKKYLEDQE